MNYTDIVKQLLDKQYPDKQVTYTITISTFNIKFIPFKAKALFQSYRHLTTLSLVNCDLRKLQNFPILPCLIDLDLSSNSLQGTLNYLMPLKSLQYLNISRNIIQNVRMLQPLRRLDKVEVYLAQNPFTSNSNWKYKVKSYSIKILKAPKEISKEGFNPNRKSKDSPVVPVKEEEEQIAVKPSQIENFRAAFQKNESSEELINRPLNSPNYNYRLQPPVDPNSPSQIISRMYKQQMQENRQRIQQRAQQQQEQEQQQDFLDLHEGHIVHDDNYSSELDINDPIEYLRAEEELLIENQDGDVYNLAEEESSSSNEEEDSDNDDDEPQRPPANF